MVGVVVVGVVVVGVVVVSVVVESVVVVGVVVVGVVVESGCGCAGGESDNCSSGRERLWCIME